MASYLIDVEYGVVQWTINMLKLSVGMATKELSPNKKTPGFFTSCTRGYNSNSLPKVGTPVHLHIHLEQPLEPNVGPSDWLHINGGVVQSAVGG